MTEKKKEEILPLPQVVSAYRNDAKEITEADTEEKWEIYGTNGTLDKVETNLENRTMVAPLFDDDVSRFVRARELVGVRISPKNMKDQEELAQQNGVPKEALIACERMRVTEVASRLEFNPDLLVNGSEKTMGERLANAGSPEAWDYCLTYGTELAGSKGFDSFVAGVRTAKPEWSKMLRDVIPVIRNKRMETIPLETLGSTELDSNWHTKRNGDVVTVPRGFKYTYAAANDLSRYFAGSGNEPSDVQEEMINRAMEKSDKGQPSNQKDGKEQPSGKPDVVHNPDGMGDNLDTEDLPDNFRFLESEGWIELVIDQSLPLTRDVSGYLHRRKTAFTTGKRVLYPWRMLTDPNKAIFGTKVKTKGGVLLFDLSGSMSLSAQQIEDILEAAPAAVIIGYSGMGYNDDGSVRPNCWVLASRGRRVANVGKVGGNGNDVDGPALVYALSKRKNNEPFIWITDGGISGTEQEQLDCMKLIKKHRIVVFQDTESAIEGFKKGKLVSQLPSNFRDIILANRGKF